MYVSQRNIVSFVVKHPFLLFCDTAGEISKGLLGQLQEAKPLTFPFKLPLELASFKLIF